MERDFRYLREQHGDAGAREIFEKICSQLFAAMYDGSAHNIKVSQGDEGVDIFVGDFSAPGDVYQCKYFIDGISDSQKQQIRNLFKRAVESSMFEMKCWVLCLPCELTIKEFQWWSEWKNQKAELHGIDITLLEGSYLIAQLKKQNLYATTFDDDMRAQLDEVLQSLTAQKQRRSEEVVFFLTEIDPAQYDDMIFVRKLENAHITEIDECKRDFFNAELAEQAVRSQGDEEKLRQLSKLKATVHSIWGTQYRRYKHNTDGNDLLTRVYERVDEFDSTTLNTQLTQYSMLAKKGILHQWAEDCAIGWLADYAIKLEQYLAEVRAEL